VAPVARLRRTDERHPEIEELRGKDAQLMGGMVYREPDRATSKARVVAHVIVAVAVDAGTPGRVEPLGVDRAVGIRIVAVHELQPGFRRDHDRLPVHDIVANDERGDNEAYADDEGRPAE